MIDVCSDNHTQYLNTLCGLKGENFGMLNLVLYKVNTGISNVI